jgi:two-component system, OmpR family, clock-associated histidine kinase SasA
MMRSSANVFTAAAWEKPLVPLGYFVYLLYFQFTLYYARIKGQRGILTVAYIVFAILIALSPTSILIKGMRIEYYGYVPVLSPVAYLLFVLPILFLSLGVLNLLRRYRAAHSTDERNRMIYLSVAAAFPFAGALIDALTNLPPTSTWANLIFCIVCSIAVMRYHLLDFRLVIRRSVVFLLLSMAVAAPYLLLLNLINYFVGPARDKLWWQIVLLLLIAAILQPLYSRIQQAVDKMFYRGRYDFLKALYDFTQESHEVGNLSRIAASLVHLTKQALSASSVHLLLGSGDDKISAIASTTDTSALSLDWSSTLVRWIAASGRVLYRKDIDIRPQLQALPRNDLNVLNSTGAELLAPLMSQGNNLVGLLIVGKKLSQRPYTEDDEQIITVVAGRMAVELENARLYDEEKKMRQELEEQEKLKSEFLRNVAHELKTPLTAIMASSELLSSTAIEKLDVETRRRLLDNLKHGSEAMNRRVNELLDIARMDVVGFTINPLPLEIASLVREVVADARIIFQSKRQSLELNIADSIPRVYADADRISQVLTNLLSNASKFSPFDSTIRVVMVQKDGLVRIEIMDMAPPIGDLEKSKIFTPYYRGENAALRERIPGLGLGLAICKKLVLLHGGEIGCYNRGPAGNVFWFTLPVYGDGQSPRV